MIFPKGIACSAHCPNLDPRLLIHMAIDVYHGERSSTAWWTALDSKRHSRQPVGGKACLFCQYSLKSCRKHKTSFVEVDLTLGHDPCFAGLS